MQAIRSIVGPSVGEWWKVTVRCFASVGLCTGLAVSTPALAEDVDALKKEIQELREIYESRIEALERKLGQVEQQQTKVKDQLEASKAPSRTVSKAHSDRSVSFNPNISVVVEGGYYTDNAGGEGGEAAGEAFRASHAGHGHDEEEGHGHGVLERGFSLREIELGLGAAVDPYFDAQALLGISNDGSVELEEAYARTLSLPSGLQVKLGKFFSDITRHNRMHPHEWAYGDQNLAYRNLFGEESNLRDVGAQLTWVAPTPFYAQLGGEILQGDQGAFGAFVDAGARESAASSIDTALGSPGIDSDSLGFDGQRSGPRLYTAFARFGPDLGPKNALQFGLWGAHTTQHQEIQELEEPDEALALQGDGYMWGIDAVFKYDSGSSYGKGDWVLQAEYLYQELDTRVTFSADDPATVGERRELVTDGFYVQGEYGFLPRWTIGARYDVLGLTNEVRGPGGTEEIDDSERLSLALSWNPTEFSRFRLQGSFADIATEDGKLDFDGVYLQYSFNFGAHPAHRF